MLEQKQKIQLPQSHQPINDQILIKQPYKQNKSHNQQQQRHIKQYHHPSLQQLTSSFRIGNIHSKQIYLSTPKNNNNHHDLLCQYELNQLLYQFNIRKSEKQGAICAYQNIAKQKIIKLQLKLSQIQKISINTSQNYHKCMGSTVKKERTNEISKIVQNNSDTSLFQVKVNKEFQDVIQKHIFPLITYLPNINHKSQYDPNSNQECYKRENRQLQQLKKQGEQLKKYLKDYSKLYGQKMQKIYINTSNEIKCIRQKMLKNKANRAKIRQKIQQAYKKIQKQLLQQLQNEQATYKNFTRQIALKLQKYDIERTYSKVNKY